MWMLSLLIMLKSKLRQTETNVTYFNISPKQTHITTLETVHYINTILYELDSPYCTLR
jgi:hypothetical protein